MTTKVPQPWKKIKSRGIRLLSQPYYGENENLVWEILEEFYCTKLRDHDKRVIVQAAQVKFGISYFDTFEDTGLHDPVVGRVFIYDPHTMAGVLERRRPNP